MTLQLITEISMRPGEKCNDLSHKTLTTWGKEFFSAKTEKPSKKPLKEISFDLWLLN